MGLISFLLLVSCLTWTTAVEASEVQVVRNAEYQQITYCLGQASCRLCWQTHLSGINKGIIQSRTRCSEPLQDQLAGLRAVMAKIISHDPGADELHTLFWGRLAPDTPQDDMQMALRLALAAFKSDHWDRLNGKPAGGQSTHWVRDLCNSAGIYPELEDLFSSFGLRVKVADVEKVLVLPAGRLPFYDRLKAYGVGKDDLLPYDCMTWFSISR